MKQIIIFLIDFYQEMISVFLKNLLGRQSFCKFSPSCSEYAKQSVSRYGAIRGGWLFISRFTKCQSLFNF